MIPKRIIESLKEKDAQKDSCLPLRDKNKIRKCLLVWVSCRYIIYIILCFCVSVWVYVWVIAYLLYVHLEIESNYPKTRTHSCISFSVKASFRTPLSF